MPASVEAAAEAEAAAAVHNILASAVPGMQRRKVVPAPVALNAVPVKRQRGGSKAQRARRARDRRNRNRESAALSRLRKQKYLEALEAQVMSLGKANAALKARMAALEARSGAAAGQSDVAPSRARALLTVVAPAPDAPAAKTPGDECGSAQPAQEYEDAEEGAEAAAAPAPAHHVDEHMLSMAVPLADDLEDDGLDEDDASVEEELLRFTGGLPDAFFNDDIDAAAHVPMFRM